MIAMIISSNKTPNNATVQALIIAMATANVTTVNVSVNQVGQIMIVQ